MAFECDIVFLTKAIARESQNSLKEICKIFTLVNFCPKILFPSFPSARYRTERSFLSASSSRIPLNFLVSHLIEADSSLSYCLCSWVFLSILERLWELFLRSSDFPNLEVVGDVSPKDLVNFLCLCSL